MIKVSKRHKARELLLQALYQWQLNNDEIIEIERQFLLKEEYLSVDAEYFRKLLFEIPYNISEVDQAFLAHSNLELSELNPVELAVLRIATYELVHCLDIPYRVVINEALELAKTYGSEAGHKFVNGVLDKVAKSTRQAEMSQARE